MNSGITVDLLSNSYLIMCTANTQLANICFIDLESKRMYRVHHRHKTGEKIV